MGVQENLASDVRRALVAHTFDYTSGARGLIPLNRRMAIVAMMTSAGVATADEPIQVTSEVDARFLFGTGSEAALAVAWALKTFRLVNRQHGGSPAAIWVVPTTAPVGTPAEHRFAVAGTASESKDLIVRVCGRTIRAPVASGDAAAAVATTLESHIAALSATNLPVTSAVVTSTNVDLTAIHHGVFGDDIAIEVVSAPAGITVTPSQTVNGAGSSDNSTALASLLTKQYWAIAIGNHASTDRDDLTTHLTSAWGPTTKLFGHGFMAETGSLSTATTLASGANDETLALITAEGCPNLPAEIAASVAAMSVSVERPAFNFNRTLLPLYAPPASAAYNGTEIETAIGGGTSPISVSESGKVVLERLVTTKTTESSAPFEDLLDLKNSKTLAYYALQSDAFAQAAQKGKNLDDDFVNLVKDGVYDILLAGQAAGDLHNVEEHREDLLVAVSTTKPDRLLVEVPQSVVQSATQLDFTHRLFVEPPAEV